MLWKILLAAVALLWLIAAWEWIGSYYAINITGDHGSVVFWGVERNQGGQDFLNYWFTKPNANAFESYTRLTHEKVVAARAWGPIRGFICEASGGTIDTSASPYSSYYSIDFKYLLIKIPFWALLCVLSIFIVLIALRTRRLSRRVRSGFCLNCGFDLRATPDQCPECGMRPAKQPGRSAT